jgi:hypothetical protein
MIRLNEHERFFDVHPVGVKYICEFCNEGEMKVDTEDEERLYIPTDRNKFMIKHKCTKCGKTLLLPKSYPYIEWIPVGEEVKSNG